MEYDYIIVGAGSAGCVLASRLTEDPSVTVLLLEAGGQDRHPYTRVPVMWRDYMKHPSYDWGFSSEPEPEAENRRIPLPRGKALGGSSTINGMMYMRGHPQDYDQWRQMGAAGWSYSDVLPYFKRSETNWRGETEHHGGSGPMAVSPGRDPHGMFPIVAAAVRATGHEVVDDHHGVHALGLAPVDMTVAKGRRASTARAYLRPALARPNLTVETSALTQRIIVEHGRAEGVVYAQHGQMHNARATREVILAGGAYNSPQLLLLSGIGPADELAAMGIPVVHDLPGVGRNLSEHPNTRAAYLVTAPVTVMQDLRLDRAVKLMLQWGLFGTGLFSGNGTVANLLARTREGLERPDIQVIFAAGRMDARTWFPGWRKPVEDRLEPTICLLHPDSRGWVRLRSTDPADAPRIQLNLYKERGDLDGLIRGIKLVREIYNSAPFKGIVAREVTPGVESGDAGIEAHIRRTGNITHHPVGTCTMGVHADAVVDPELRVRGIEGLRVADASIMPTVVGGNTNAAVIMIGEKAADLIRGRSLAAAA